MVFHSSEDGDELLLLFLNISWVLKYYCTVKDEISYNIT
jgi:hypothetical protein